MLDLFRFVMLRPPDQPDDDSPSEPSRRSTPAMRSRATPTRPARTDPPADQPARQKTDEDVLTKHRRLSDAYRILTRLDADDLTLAPAPKPLTTPTATPALNETERALRTSAGALVHEQLADLRDGDDSIEKRIAKWHIAQQFAAAERIGSPDGAVAPVVSAGAVTPAQLNLRREALGKFSSELHAALANIDVSLDRTPVTVAADRVREALIEITPQAMAATRALNPRLLGVDAVVPIGQQFFAATDVAGTQAVQLTPGNTTPLPGTSMSAHPVVIGDLLVVKQQMTGYGRSEIAYIENILRGESYKRGVTRSETIEESTLTETESLREESRDLQATDRFELKRESENVLTLDGNVSRAPRSPAYGPVVDFQNDPESQLHGSQQLSEKRAETFGRDVTNRAASRVSDRVRTQVTRRVVRQFEERSEHAFVNDKPGADNVVGVYQWIDKIYEAQIFNYGRRLFYDLVVPEPAAFLLQAFARARTEGRGLSKPISFAVLQPDGTERPLQPDDITETNFAYLAGVYQATGVKAPPDAYVTVTRTYVGSAPQNIASLELTPPQGYTVVRTMSTLFTVAKGYVVPTALDVDVTKGEHWHASLGCARTQESYRQWQLATYEALLRSSRQKQDAYEGRLANLEAAMRIGALGQSAEQKRQLERDELKKSCITILSEQHFDAFNGIDATFPQPDVPTLPTQARFIRFFEHALEWEQMTYRFFPYFWSRKANWMQKVNYEDADPQFADFLKAGAARVLLPIRPGFERAMIHFIESAGEIWEGEGDPPVVSDTYAAALADLEAAAEIAQAPAAYGKPWTVRLPTTLVMLRKDGTLPKWTKVGGEWVPED